MRSIAFLFSKTTLSILLSVSLLVTNFLSLTSSMVHDTLYGLIDRTHITRIFPDSPTKRAQILKLQQQRKINRLKGVITKVTRRTARNVGINVASVPAESLPWLGVATVVGVTAMDIKDGCDTLKDMNSILKSMDLETHDEETTVCGYTLPTSEEIVRDMQSKITLTKEMYKEFQDKLGDTLDAVTRDIESHWKEFKESMGNANNQSAEHL